MKSRLILGVAGVAVLGLVTGVVATSCAQHSVDGTESDSVSSASGTPSFEQAVSPLGDRQDAIDAVWMTRNLREVLPNAKFSIEGSEPMPEFEGIVEGRVVAVSEPRAFHDDVSQNSATATEVEASSKDVSWGLVEITLEVANDFDPTAETPSTLVVGMTVYDLGEEARSLTDLQGQHVIVSYDRIDPFPADPDQLFVARAGTLLGSVTEDGRISLPMLGEEEKSFVGDYGTLESLTAASEEPAQVIDLKNDGIFSRNGE